MSLLGVRREGHFFWIYFRVSHFPNCWAVVVLRRVSWVSRKTRRFYALCFDAPDVSCPIGFGCSCSGCADVWPGCSTGGIAVCELGPVACSGSAASQATGDATHGTAV